MYPPVSDEFWKFVRDNARADVSKLRLKYHGAESPAIDYEAAITQIECRQRFGSKLADTLGSAPEFFFANTLAGEQSTSYALAAFHASLMESDGLSVTDLTCGLGIDVFHLARRASQVTGIDWQEHLAEALGYNARQLGLGNVRGLCGDSVSMLTDGKLHADMAFIDPARRGEDGKRLFAVADCQPDVVALMPELRKCFRFLVVKLSPMLDVTQCLRELGKNVTDIYALGTRTECKELVAALDFSNETDCPGIHAVTVGNDGKWDDFSFTIPEEEAAAPPRTIAPKAGWAVYEPFPAVMKAAPLKLLASRFQGLAKLASNTHVYTSEVPIAAFPGTAWKVDEVVEWKSKNIKRLKSRLPQADVAVRNFGMSAAELQSKLGNRQGGNARLLGVTDSRGERLMLGRRPE